MNDPEKYFSVKETVVGKLNLIFVPKLFHAMSWNFTNGNILDYGCGPGNLGYQYILPKAKETDSKMYSVDISSEMVEFSRKHFPHPRITYKIGSLPHDFPTSEKFDRVFAVHVLHFIPDLLPFLKGIQNILKPGGQFGFTAATIDHIVFKTHQYLIDSPVWQPYMKGLKDYMPEWSKVEAGENASDIFRNLFVESTGLKEVFFLYTRPVYEMTMDQYLDFAMSCNPLVRTIPNNLVDKLRKVYCRLVTNEQQDLLDDSNSNIVQLSCGYVCAVLQK